MSLSNRIIYVLWLGTYNQGGYTQSSSGQGGNNGYYNHSHNQSNGPSQGPVGYNGNNDTRLDRNYGSSPGPGAINETKLASMFSADVITRLDQAMGAKRWLDTGYPGLPKKINITMMTKSLL